jgi:hypothetical protein
MLRNLLAALVLLVPAAAAQTPERAAYTARLERLRAIVIEAVRLTPRVEYLGVQDSDRLAANDRTAATARENEPRLGALLAELDAMPKLAPLGDSTRDASIASLQVEVRQTVLRIAVDLPALKQSAAADWNAQSDKLMQGWSLGFSAARNAETILILSRALDLEPSRGQRASEAFLYISNARHLFQGVISAGKYSASAREGAERIGANLRALTARLAASGEVSSSYLRALDYLSGTLQDGVNRLSAETYSEVAMVAVLTMLGTGSRDLIEAM